MKPHSYLIFDTETTGIVAKSNFFEESDAPVQFYGGLFIPPDDLGEWFETDGVHLAPTGAMAAQQEYNMLICLPEGKEIHPKAEEVHGISKETADTFGASRTNAAHIITDLICVADTAVAHNLDYDRRIINHLMYREGLITKVDFPNGIWSDTEMYCTMKTLTNVCKIPGRNGYKWPNLKEAYRFFFNTDFKGKAHDASADSIACAEIFFAMKFLEQRHGKA